MKHKDTSAEPSQRPAWLRRLLAEPLLHFTVLGAGLFALYLSVNDRPAAMDPNRILIDEAQVQRLVEPFERTWMRPPTRQKLKGLVSDYVKEEILFREASALGLNKDDLVVRRRMRQKMEFLNADLTEPATPTDAELQAYLDSHRDRFSNPACFSVMQVYIRPHDRGDDVRARADALLGRLVDSKAARGDIAGLGDATLLPSEMREVSV